jgi:hypothetical protein
MDNYLLMGHILKCSLLEKDEVHPQLWVGADKKWRVVHNDRVERQKFNRVRCYFRQLLLHPDHVKVRTDEQKEKSERKLLQRQEQKKRKLLESGIDYDMSAVEYVRSSSFGQHLEPLLTLRHRRKHDDVVAMCSRAVPCCIYLHFRIVNAFSFTCQPTFDLVMIRHSGDQDT